MSPPPDILVRDDTLTTAEQTLSKAFAPKQQDVYVTLADYALEPGALDEFPAVANPVAGALPRWLGSVPSEPIIFAAILGRGRWRLAKPATLAGPDSHHPHPHAH